MVQETRWLFANKDCVVEIEWCCEDAVIVSTTDPVREEIGRAVVYYVEGDPFGQDDRWLIAQICLDGPDGSGRFLRKGIGREIIRTLGQDLAVVFSESLRVGGHADDPANQGFAAFARQMVAEGLAEWEGQSSGL